jgi:hypothetical protein
MFHFIFHHKEFFAGLFSGGTIGYVFGSAIKASILAELATLRAIFEAGKKAA